MLQLQTLTSLSISMATIASSPPLPEKKKKEGGEKGKKTEWKMK